MTTEKAKLIQKIKEQLTGKLSSIKEVKIQSFFETAYKVLRAILLMVLLVIIGVLAVKTMVLTFNGEYVQSVLCGVATALIAFTRSVLV